MKTQRSFVDLTDQGASSEAGDTDRVHAADVRLLLRAERDRAIAYALIFAGAIGVLVCWIGVSDTPFVADQLSYIASGGIGGLFLLAFGLSLLVSADHHDEWRKLDRIEAALGLAPEATGRHTRPGEGRRAGLGVLGLGTVCAVVIIAIGWSRASGTGDHGVSTEGITMSIGGLMVALASSAAYLLPSRQRLMRRRAHLLRGFYLTDALNRTAGRPTGADALVVAEGLSRYHRAGCRAVDGLAVTTVTRAGLDPRLTECELCAPTGPASPTTTSTTQGDLQ
jgi:hypothetical protein